ncbi:hypothetical protein E4U50_001224 [Claviceps purpurea]|nr:hypothetical protein E4U50_001224 [Claviceps purpurea]
MGQYWIIAALDSKKLLFNAHIKLGELLFEPAVAEDVERALAVPVVPTYHDSRPENVKSHHSAAGVGTMDRKPGSFSRFPTEIHRLIFEHCYDDDLKSVVFLGVTNQYFWSIAREYVVRDFTQTFGVWAGQQLITVGDYVKVDDYPPGLFATEEDKENLLKRRPEDEESEDEGSEDEVYQLPVEQQTLTLYERISRSFTRLPDARSTSFDRDYSILDALAQDPCYRTVLDSDASFCLVFHGVPIRPWHCTTQQDESTEAFAIWAGHRFDITTMTRHEKLTAGQNWTDVTEELVEEVTAIWSAEMGPNWKQKVLEQQ